MMPNCTQLLLFISVYYSFGVCLNAKLCYNRNFVNCWVRKWLSARGSS